MVYFGMKRTCQLFVLMIATSSGLTNARVLLDRIASQYYMQQPIVTDWVARSVYHTSEPFKNGCADWDAVWVEESCGPREPCITWGLYPPREGAILRGGERGIPL